MKTFFFIIIIIIFIIIIYFSIYNQKNIEFFDKNNECNSFFNNNSFCAYDFNTQKCGCKYQKDDLRYIFNSPSYCCERKCQNFSKEECLYNEKNTEKSYYCNIGNKCKKYKGTIISSHIAANYCGNDPLNNQLLLPYTEEEECIKNIGVCDKYNNPNKTKSQNKEECLQDFNCGYCINEFGGGKCISGTASGPNDLQRYYYCEPGNVSGKNQYVYGNHVAYLLQS